MKLTFTVTGMTCAACSARVEKVSRAVPGVAQADVNLLAGTMQGVAEGYFAAMFAPFFGRFVAQGMRLTLSLFFWITPVAWPAARLNGANAMMALSPIHYVVDTARAAVLAGAPFPAWNRTLWFWCLMIGLAIAGAAGCSRLHEPYREVL